MNIENIKLVRLYEIPYEDRLILMTHSEFEKWGVGSKHDLLANTKGLKDYYQVTIDGIAYTVPIDKFESFIKNKKDGKEFIMEEHQE